MKHTLRSYQLDGLERTRQSIRNGNKRILCVGPTGMGKTVFAGAMIEGATQRGKRILFLAHRKELIDQPSALLDEMGIDHGIIKATHWRTRPELPVQVASVQTLVNRDKPPADLVFVDEAHRCMAPTYTQILEHYPDAIGIGLTATPWRLDGQGLGAIYQDLVVIARVLSLVDQGYLIEPRVFVPHIPELTGVKRSGGDYNAKDLQTLMDRSELVGDIVDHWLRIARGRPTVCFAAGVDHSKHIVEKFQAAGIRAAHVDGTMGDERRERVLSDLASGAVDVVSNCDVITEGYDLPRLSCAIFARPTQSTTKYLQMAGRIMRPLEGKKDSIILDHAGLTVDPNHGRVTDWREYTLDGKQKIVKPIGVKICPACFAVAPSVASICPECGATLKRTIDGGRGDPEQRDGELHELDSLPGPRCPACNSPRTTELQQYSPFQFLIRCEACGATNYATDHERAKHATMDEKRSEYKRLQAIAQRKGYKKGWISHRYRALFGVWPRGVQEEEDAA